MFQCRQFNLRRRTATGSEAATQPLAREEDEVSQDTLTFTQTADPDTYVATIGGWMPSEAGSSSQDGEEEPEIYSQPDLYPPLEEPEIYPQPDPEPEAAKPEAGAQRFQDFEVRGQELQMAGVYTQGEDKENIPPGQSGDTQDITRNPDIEGPGPDLFSLARDWEARAAMRTSIATTPDNPPLRRPHYRIQVHK